MLFVQGSFNQVYKAHRLYRHCQKGCQERKIYGNIKIAITAGLIYHEKPCVTPTIPHI